MKKSKIEKTLILVETDPSNIFTNELKNKGYNVDLFFKEVNILLRALRKLWLKLNLPFSNIWFNNWFKDLNKYETLIINVNRLNHNTFKEILNKLNNIRIIGWYWNTIDSENYPINYKNSNVEYWSFDDKDCEKYNLKNNIQFYCAGDLNKNRNKEFDVYFIGREKGRTEEIESFKKIANTNGLNCSINIVNSNNIIPYNDIKKQLAKSKAVLEINKENQSGLTLRALESLFFGIKLITNNKNILNMPFYNKENIFILGIDDNNKLNGFVNSNYNHDSDKYKDNYDVDMWFNNFFK